MSLAHFQLDAGVMLQCSISVINSPWGVISQHHLWGQLFRRGSYFSMSSFIRVGSRVGSCWVFIANTFFSPHQQSVLQGTTFRPGCPSHFQVKQQKKKMPTFLNVLLLLSHLSCSREVSRCVRDVIFHVPGRFLAVSEMSSFMFQGGFSLGQRCHLSCSREVSRWVRDVTFMFQGGFSLGHSSTATISQFTRSSLFSHDVLAGFPFRCLHQVKMHPRKSPTQGVI